MTSKISTNWRNIILIAIVLISTFMHFQHFSKDLMSIHVWRQTQTQSTIINFYEEDMNIFNPRRNDRGDTDGIFRMEFPLMQWSVAGLYRLFGNHLIITRITMFIIGLFSVWGIYTLLFAIFKNQKIGLIGAWAFNFSPAFYYYTINPLPDNLALCCGIWGLAFFFLWVKDDKRLLLLFAGILLSISCLCKLPFVVYYSVPATYFAIKFFQKKFKLWYEAFLVFFLLIFPLVWYVNVIPHWSGNGVVNGVMDNKISMLSFFDYLQHNVISTLPELLLNYAALPFFLYALYTVINKKQYKHALFLPLFTLSIALSAYFFFEINMIAKVHDYYLFPFYPILFILVGYGAYLLLSQKQKWLRVTSIFLIFMLPFTAYIRMHHRWSLETPGINKDLLVYKNELRNSVANDALCVVGNDVSSFVFFYYIDKKGWAFDSDELSGTQLKNMIDRGAQYLYSDSRSVNGHKDIIPYLNQLVFETESIKVYSLKK